MVFWHATMQVPLRWKSKPYKTQKKIMASIIVPWVIHYNSCLLEPVLVPVSGMHSIPAITAAVMCKRSQKKYTQHSHLYCYEHCHHAWLYYYTTSRNFAVPWRHDCFILVSLWKLWHTESRLPVYCDLVALATVCPITRARHYHCCSPKQQKWFCTCACWCA